MRHLRGLAVVLPRVMATSVAVAEDEVPPQNWGAPPYWSPQITDVNRRVPEHAALATVGNQPSRSGASATLLPPPLPFVPLQPRRVVDTPGRAGAPHPALDPDRRRPGRPCERPGDEHRQPRPGRQRATTPPENIVSSLNPPSGHLTLPATTNVTITLFGDTRTFTKQEERRA